MNFDEIAFLQAFVAIPSPSYHEAQVANFLATTMETVGISAHVDEVGNAIGSVGTAGPLVVLLGHIDTVPGDIPVRIEQDTLYGRGSVDAKGSFATFVCATARAIAQGTLACRVVLIGAVEEEVASSRGARHITDRYAPDYCVIGEPSQWDRITLGYKGRLLAHYRHEQAGAHSASADQAAAEYVCDFWQAVRTWCIRYNQKKDRLFEQVSPTLHTIRNGSDGLYDWAEATIGLRLPEALPPEQVAATLREQAGTDGSVSFDEQCPAFRSQRTTKLANGFVRSIRTVGGKPGFVHKTGTSDMNIVGPAWNIPMVAYGPGDSQLDHTPNEHVVLDDYRRAIAVLTGVLEHIA
jgi:LysW-gamma-L-lysine carboxypeptidase